MINPKLLLTELKKTFGDIASNLTEEAVEMSLNLGQQLAQGKMRIKDVLQISDKHMEALYAIAYNFYQENKYEDANKIFTFLCRCDPIKPKFWEGLAATEKLQKHYNEAITFYYVLTQIRPLKISYYLDLAECFIKMDQKSTAKQCCQLVEFMVGNPVFNKENSDAETCLKKAKLMQKFLKK